MQSYETPEESEETQQHVQYLHPYDPNVHKCLPAHHNLDLHLRDYGQQDLPTGKALRRSQRVT